MKSFSVFLLFISFLACSDPVYKPGKEVFTRDDLTFRAIPNAVNIGQQIKIIDNMPDSSNRFNLITFFGVGDWVYTDSIINDTMFVIVPFTARTGPIEVGGKITIYDTVSHVLGTVDDFTVYGLPYQRVDVYWSDLNYSLTKAMATQTGFSSIYKTWQATISADTVKIYGIYGTGDFTVEYFVNFLNKGAGILPEFIDGRSIHHTDVANDVRINQMTQGIIKIQDWDVSKHISGRVFGPPWTSSEYTFWIEF